MSVSTPAATAITILAVGTALIIPASSGVHPGPMIGLLAAMAGAAICFTLIHAAYQARRLVPVRIRRESADRWSQTRDREDWT